jgi:DNA-directed RNA polymerase subunit N
MIIPVKCFTCGNVLADKYKYYCEKVREKKIELGQQPNDVVYFKKDVLEKTPEGLVLDELNLTKSCCRRHMLSHVDIKL